MRKIGFALLVSAFALSACSSGGPGAEPTAMTSPKVTIGALPFSLSVDGAVKTKVEGTTQLRRVLFINNELESSVRYFGMEPADWVSDGASLEVKASLNIIPFEGDKSYTVAATQALDDPSDVATAGQGLSNARFELRSPGKLQTLRIFSVIKKDCDVQLRDNGEAGSVYCPQLSDGKANVSLRMSWG